MKKIKRPKGFKISRKKEVKHERITNETVAQHREKILAGGRKFKYPVQYAQHRLVINTIIISLLALVVLVGVSWWQLYSVQNTGSFFYRITQLVQLPVASVDKRPVAYSDYLMQYRSSIHWLESNSRTGLFNINSEDGKREATYYKRQSLDRAIENAYAQKIAEKINLSISDKEIDDFIANALKASSTTTKPSEEAYKAVLSESLGVSTEEYRLIVKQALLKQKVSFAVDTDAKKKILSAQAALKKRVPFEDVVVTYSDDTFAKTSKGDVGFVPRNNQDEGLVAAAAELKIGVTSDIIKSLDGYYIVKLVDIKEDQVRYSRIKVKLNTFNQQLTDLKKAGKVKEFISLKTQ